MAVLAHAQHVGQYKFQIPAYFAGFLIFRHLVTPIVITILDLFFNQHKCVSVRTKILKKKTRLVVLSKIVSE